MHVQNKTIDFLLVGEKTQNQNLLKWRSQGRTKQ